MAEKVFTGAMGIVKVNGNPVGKIQSIRGTENTNRARVGGLGTILPCEVQVVQWSGSLSCSYYLIQWKNATIPNSIRRDVSTDQEFENYLILQEEGVTIDIYKKVTDLIDPETKLPKSKPESFATIRGCFSESESWNLAEGQVGGHDQTFQYIHPVIFS
jgi:hypothetical protein